VTAVLLKLLRFLLVGKLFPPQRFVASFLIYDVLVGRQVVQGERINTAFLGVGAGDRICYCACLEITFWIYFKREIGSVCGCAHRDAPTQKPLKI
jgi:hypothetical protein